MRSSDIIRWDAFSPEAGASLVLPDGCHDLILRLPPDGRPRWMAVPLMDRAVQVHSQAGERYIGFRLKPWLQLDTAALAASLQSRHTPDPDQAWSLLGDRLQVAPDLAEALHALCISKAVSDAHRQLGVSERSLQRLVSGQTGRPPSYWRGLARVRQAARSLHGPRPGWAEWAVDQGYADQAHLCREFQRWFGLSPRQFLAQPDSQALAAAPGFEQDTQPMGVQSSIRNPSASAT